jgi:hypothetical protein
MACRGTPNICMESVFKSAEANDTRRGVHNERRPALHHFQAAHLLSALVVYAWAPGIVATTL